MMPFQRIRTGAPGGRHQVNFYYSVGYPLLVVSVLEVILGIIILRQNIHRSPVNRSVAAFSFFAAAYALISAVILLRSAQGLPVDLLARLNWIGWFMTPAALQFLYFMRDERSRMARTLGYVLYPFWTAVLLLCIFTDLVEPSGYSLVPRVDHAGPLENAGRFIGGLLILWVMGEAVYLKRRFTGIKQRQLSLFFRGTIIFGAGAALVSGFIPLIGTFVLTPELGSYFGFPWIILTGYAIMRYSLFDIRVVLSRTLAAALIWIAFIGAFLWIVHLLEPFTGHSLSMLISLSLLGFIVYGTPLSRWMQTSVQRMVVKGKYDYQQVLKESINAVISILDQNELLDFIITTIRDSMWTKSVYLYWRSPEGRYVRRHGFGKLLASGEERILADSAVTWVLKKRKPLSRQEYAKTIKHDETDTLLRYLDQTDLELLIPMSFKGEVVGILALGVKGSEDPYLQSDLDLLEALSGHASVAMENARLYEEAKQVKASLHESEEKFRTLAHTLPAGIFIHRGGKFLYANPAINNATGYSTEELLNMDFWAVTHPAYRQLIISRGRARLQGGSDEPPPQYEFKIIRKDGAERWVLMTAATIEYAGQSAIIGTIFDITDRKLAEEEKTRLNEENIRQYQQRIEEEERHVREKEKILRDLHDGIGGITTNIRLLSEMARNSNSMPDIKKALFTISSLAREGLTDIRGFMHSLDAKDMSWQSLMAELRSQGSGMIEPHGIAFEMTSSFSGTTQPPGSLFCLNLFKVYKEALVNVIKHARAKSVNVHLQIDENRLVLSIADNGIGIGEQAGNGRGLANIRSRVEELEGEAVIEKGKGTTIRVSLPLPRNYPAPGMA